jgi:hypothetical protein
MQPIDRRSGAVATGSGGPESGGPGVIRIPNQGLSVGFSCTAQGDAYRRNAMHNILYISIIYEVFACLESAQSGWMLETMRQTHVQR